MDVDSSCVSPQENSNELLEYSHIIVPSTMRSRYWRYFGFPGDSYNNIITKKKIICTLCSTSISYNKNTTNLRTHLVAKHPHVLYQLNNNKRLKEDDKNPDSSNDSKIKFSNIRHLVSVKDLEGLSGDDEPSKLSEQTGIADVFAENEVIENEPEKVEDRNDYPDYSSSLEHQTYQIEEIDEATPLTQEAIFESVKEMLIKDLLSPSLVEGSGFTNFVYTISPNTVLPSRKQLETNLKIAHATIFNSQVEIIKSHTNTHPFSLGLEIWSNVEQETFTHLYINFISQQNDQFLNNFLLKTVCLSDSTNLDIFEGINMANCSAAIVNNKTDVICDFFNAQGIPTVPCFATIIRKCMLLVFQLPEVDTILKQIQKYLKNQSTCQDDANPPRIHNEFPITKLNLLSYFCEKYSASYSSWVEELDIGVLLEKAEEIAECLSPLKVTLETLADESAALCSLLKPLATKLLNEYFCVYDEDPEIVTTIKEIVTRELSECILNNSFLTVATFFDPRFLNYIDADNFQMIKQFINVKLPNVKEEINISIKECAESQNRRKSSLKMFFKNDDLKRAPKVTKTSAELEIQKYTNELCDMEQCPITWWNECGYVYRHLKTIARNYVCVPATINGLFKKPIIEQMDFYNKQQMLRCDCERSLLFLHLNK